MNDGRLAQYELIGFVTSGTERNLNCTRNSNLCEAIALIKL